MPIGVYVLCVSACLPCLPAPLVPTACNVFCVILCDSSPESPAHNFQPYKGLHHFRGPGGAHPNCSHPPARGPPPARRSHCRRHWPPVRHSWGGGFPAGYSEGLWPNRPLRAYLHFDTSVAALGARHVGLKWGFFGWRKSLAFGLIFLWFPARRTGGNGCASGGQPLWVNMLGFGALVPSPPPPPPHAGAQSLGTVFPERLP